jgi:FixJ family two-component response regulator
MNEDGIVFVIDHDHSARIGLTSLLRTAGYNIREFASVNEFLDVLNPDVSGCIILDATMPGLSGEELLEELKARGVHLPIIVVSCDDEPVDGAALLDAVNWALRSLKMDSNNDVKFF